MGQLSKHKLDDLLQRCQNGITSNEKGKALEDLICYIFSKVPGLTFNRRDAKNFLGDQEIDIVFWNERLSFLPSIIFVECKNWSKPVGSDEVTRFETKLRDRCLDFGILIAANGITGDQLKRTEAHHAITNALQAGKRIIVITLSEMYIVKRPKQLIDMFKKTLCDLHVNGTSIQITEADLDFKITDKQT